MKYKGRIKFAVDGFHPLLELASAAFTLRGLVRVEAQDADFILVGPIGYTQPNPRKAYLILSDDCVYLDRDASLNVLDKTPTKEDMPVVIPGVAASITPWICQIVACENAFITTAQRTIVARISNVFGPNVPGTLVSDVLSRVKSKEIIEIYSPGYQTRTLLHEDDFAELLYLLATRLVNGTTGTFNVAGIEEISIKRLCDTLWQIQHGANTSSLIAKKPIDRYYRWWVLPDMTKTLAVTSFKFPQSLRSRLRSLL